MRPGLTFVVLLITIPRCTCGQQASCDIFEPPQDCTEITPAPGTHSIGLQQGCASTCVNVCVAGFSDCDGNLQNGCETVGTCNATDSSAFVDAPVSATLVATLSGSPRGVASCTGKVFYFDDDTLYADGTMVLVSQGVPTGGLVCEGFHLYWSTLASGDGAPDGVVWDYNAGSNELAQLATSLDPGRSIDVRSARAYWIVRADGGTMLASGSDEAGVASLMPADESATYKSFALANDGDYALGAGSIWFHTDAGATVIGDAGTFAALVATSSSVVFGVTNDNDAATLVELDSPFVTFPLGGDVVATTMFGKKVVIASDDTVTFVDVSKSQNAVSTAAEKFLHVAYVAADATHAYWVTRGEGTTPGAVWSRALP